MPKINAFVARSFSADDEPKINPILDFLGSFRDSGFLVQTAERADVESVSKKVRQMIDGSDVFIGIFTRRYPIYHLTSLWRILLPKWLGRSQPDRWMAPAWVIQESGYALKAIEAKRKMILFRERGVELPSLQGDLEYIEFEANDFALTFQKASEMINRLLSEAAGIVVETVVRDSPSSSVPEADSKVLPPVQPEKSDTPTVELGDLFQKMLRAIDDKNWDIAKQAHLDALNMLKEGNSGSGIFWSTMYHRMRYCAGQPDGLDALRSLAKENPENPDPVYAVGVCFYQFREYEKAAEFFLAAAKLSRGDERLSDLVQAAKALREAKKLERAIAILLDAAREGGSQLQVRNELYMLLKEKGDTYVAFAVGESNLFEHPGAVEFRFSLAYDYGEKTFFDLSLFHYRILRDNDKTDAVLNNLGAAYSALNLPILSVDSYIAAYEEGNTLAADNLARRYLHEGFVSDAVTLVKQAMTHENYDPKLRATLAALDENRERENSQEKSFNENAELHRGFLLALGGGYLDTPIAVDGTWRFANASIPLTLTGGLLKGEVEITVDLPPTTIPGMFETGREKKQERRRIQFFGQVYGRACSFKIETKNLSGAFASMAHILSGELNIHEGYIVFSADANSGRVCEFKNSKPSEFYEISRVA